MNLKVIKRLGAGGFGVVDLVEDSNGNQFARKTFSCTQPLPDTLLENVRRRFIREARIQKGFKHNNIVSVLHAELDGDAPFYLMPVAVSSLDVDLRRDKKLGGGFVSAISDIVAALDELHTVGIYHRDLKPQNVLRFSDAGKDYYAVSDFGLISLQDSTISKLTTTGMAKGSDYYTAPEITADLGKASAQSDIFSIGCILHDMLGEGHRIPCHEIREDGDYGAVITGCTRSDPARRFKTAKSMLDALVSIDPSAPTLVVQDAKNLVAALSSEEALSEAQWQVFVAYVEDNASTQDVKTLLLKLTSDRITELCTSFPSLAERLGGVFAGWVERSAFDFNSCDGIANRLEIFIRSGSVGLKAEGLLALLALGVSHNRWYVERMFFNSCKPEMDDTLAKRMAIEFRTKGDGICDSIAHLEKSISIKRNDLHPRLAKVLTEICT